MESEEHTGPLLAHNWTQAHKLACMHAMCLHARAYMSAKLGKIREIKVSMESGAHNLDQARKFSCMQVIFCPDYTS